MNQIFVDAMKSKLVQLCVVYMIRVKNATFVDYYTKFTKFLAQFFSRTARMRSLTLVPQHLSCFSKQYQYCTLIFTPLFRMEQRELEGLLSNRGYFDPSRTARDMLFSVEQCPSLEIFNVKSSDGDLSELRGTLPIYYRGAVYNIPISIALPLQYPHDRPLCHVRPAPGMVIKNNHRHVSKSDGNVYLPYISSWNARANLCELLTLMASIFSEDPPVYSVQPLPRISKEVAQSKLEKMRTTSMMRQPPEPAYPNPGNAVHSHNRTKSSLQQNLHSNLATEAVVSPPSYAAALGDPPVNTTNSTMIVDSSTMPPPSFAEIVSCEFLPGFSTHAPGRRSDSGLIFDLPTHAERSAEKDRLVQEITIQLQSWLKAYQQKSSLNLSDAVAHQAALMSMQRSLDQNVGFLDEELSMLQSQLLSMQKRTKDIDNWLKEYEDKPSLSIDLAVSSQDANSSALLREHATDKAIDDCLLELDRGLAEKLIDMPTFVRYVRDLAGRQFRSRVIQIAVLSLTNNTSKE